MIRPHPILPPGPILPSFHPPHLQSTLSQPPHWFMQPYLCWLVLGWNVPTQAVGHLCRLIPKLGLHCKDSRKGSVRLQPCYSRHTTLACTTLAHMYVLAYSGYFLCQHFSEVPNVQHSVLIYLPPECLLCTYTIDTTTCYYNSRCLWNTLGCP